jgi:hypothetical protein
MNTCPDCHIYLPTCCFHRYGKYDVYYYVGHSIPPWINIYPTGHVSPLLLTIGKLTLLDEERIDKFLMLK